MFFLFWQVFSDYLVPERKTELIPSDVLRYHLLPFLDAPSLCALSETCKTYSESYSDKFFLELLQKRDSFSYKGLKVVARRLYFTIKPEWNAKIIEVKISRGPIGFHVEKFHWWNGEIYFVCIHVNICSEER